MRLFNSPGWTRCLQVFRTALVVSVMLKSFQLQAQTQGKEYPMEHPTFYRTKQIDGLSIFYREAGPKDAPNAENLFVSSWGWLASVPCGEAGLGELIFSIIGLGG